MSDASQPNTTLQKPKPDSLAETNLSRCRYLPRKTPSISVIATFTLLAPALRTRSSNVFGESGGLRIRAGEYAKERARESSPNPDLGGMRPDVDDCATTSPTWPAPPSSGESWRNPSGLPSSRNLPGVRRFAGRFGLVWAKTRWHRYARCRDVLQSSRGVS